MKMEKLVVKSFITSLPQNSQEKIKGGTGVTRGTVQVFLFSGFARHLTNRQLMESGLLHF